MFEVTPLWLMPTLGGLLNSGLSDLIGCGLLLLLPAGAVTLVVMLVRKNTGHSKLTDKDNETIFALSHRVRVLEQQMYKLTANASQTATQATQQPAQTKSATVTPINQPSSNVFDAIADLKAKKLAEQNAASAAPVHDVNESTDELEEIQDDASAKPAQPSPPAQSKPYATAHTASIPAPTALPAPAPKTSVEERLGAGVFIWIGGISLGLAGAFMVKYSFDNNLITPLMRVLLGTAFGLGLLGGAQFMHKKSRKIASAMAGAGVADLFACLLAANSLYHLIGTNAAFALMVAVTGVAILLSMRHGRLVAVLGLVGGFATPAIIGQGHNQVGPLLAYLMLLQIAMTLVSRRRAWLGMTTLTMLGGILWSIILMVQGLSEQHRYMLEFFVIAGGVLYVISASRMAAGEKEARQDSPFDAVKIAMSSVTASAMLIGVLVYMGRFGVMDLAMLGLLGAAILVLARVRSAYGPMAVLAGVVTFLTMVAWLIHTSSPRHELPIGMFWVTTLAYGLLYGLGSYIAMWRSRQEFRWASGSVVAAIAFYIIAKVGIESLDSVTAVDILPWLPGKYDWTAIAGVLGIVYALLAYPVWRARLLYLQGNSALGILVIGSGLFVGMAAQLGLDFPWQLSVWAAEVAILAYLVQWQRVALIRTFAAAIATFATIFLILPGASKIDFGPQLIFNTILPAYAMPAVALGIAAWLLRAKRDAKVGHFMRLLAIIIAAVGTLALVRHGYHPANLTRGDVTLYEWATYSVVALSLGHGLLIWHRLCPGWPQQVMAALLLLLGIVDVVGGAGFAANPLWHAYSIGSWPVINGLLFVYGAPALLIAGLLWNRPHTYDTQLNNILPAIIGSITFLITFVLVSLQVRQYFHHPMLNTDGMSNPEMYSYSVAWIIMGIVLVAIGIRFKSRSMRYASLAVMLIAIGKVFLLDTAHLQDLYRVISFLGLGITLMVLGYVYQKFVFKKTAVEV